MVSVGDAGQIYRYRTTGNGECVRRQTVIRGSDGRQNNSNNNNKKADDNGAQQ